MISLLLTTILITSSIHAAPDPHSREHEYRSSSGGYVRRSMDWDTTKTCADELSSQSDGDCDSFEKCCRNLCSGQYQSDCSIRGQEAQVRCSCQGGRGGGGGGGGGWNGGHGHGAQPGGGGGNGNDMPGYYHHHPHNYETAPPSEQATMSPIRPSPIGGGGGGGGNQQCGVPRIQPVARIVGGSQAISHSWPWQISLQYQGRHLCGGSLIGPTQVLTAAHCFGLSKTARNYKVVVGMHDKTNVDGTAMAVSRIYVHPQYDEDGNSHDAAIAILSQPVTNPNASTICLPKQDVAAGTSCEATGWGTTDGTGNNRYLLQVRVPIVDRKVCNDRQHYNGAIDDTMICAGQAGKDSCQGDSGGPLVCQRSDGVWELQGITSWGSECAQVNKPGVYTHVMAVKDWITKTMNS